MYNRTIYLAELLSNFFMYSHRLFWNYVTDSCGFLNINRMLTNCSILNFIKIYSILFYEFNKRKKYFKNISFFKIFSKDTPSFICQKIALTPPSSPSLIWFVLIVEHFENLKNRFKINKTFKFVNDFCSWYSSFEKLYIYGWRIYTLIRDGIKSSW